MTIVLAIFQICLIIYILVLIWFLVGLFRTGSTRTQEQPMVSVIIAARDGETQLGRLMEQLGSQDYPASQMECVIVDDGLLAKARKGAEEYVARNGRFKLVDSTAGDDRLKYKKRALDAGIRASSGKILLFTDVDCQVGSAWVSTMVSYFTADIDYVIGWSQIAPRADWTPDEELVELKDPLTLFEQLDYLMLMLAARGSTMMGTPLASSGQNQAYRRSVYEGVGGFRPLANRLQGDDSLFMRLARRRAKIRITFAIDPDGKVMTDPSSSWKQLLFQRVRWAGDAVAMWRLNPAFMPIPIATFGANALILVLAVTALKSSELILPVLIPGILLKALAEIIYLWIGSARASLADFRRHFALWFLIQIPYITVVGLASFWGNRLPWRRSTEIKMNQESG
jgi:cellulose synthase/poly-beta-1,6-N-acetylglucosamine synthase-like glycosyltransferase